MRKVGIVVITGTEDMKKRLAKNFFFEQVITKLVDCVHHEFVLRVMGYIRKSVRHWYDQPEFVITGQSYD